MAHSLNNLAVLYHSMGNYPQAEELYQQALSIRKKVLGSEHPDVATILDNLGALYIAIDKLDQAYTFSLQASKSR